MPSIDDHIARIQASTVFQGLSRESVQEFAPLLQVEKVPAGTVLMDMDAPGDKVFIVAEGHVKVSRVTKHGDETTLNELGPGDIVGELASLSGHMRSARVTTTTDATLLSIDGDTFEQLLKKHHEVSLNLLREMGRRLRKANDNVVAKLEEQRINIEARMQRLHNLTEASKSINSTLDLDQLLSRILDAATRSIGADRGTVYLLDEIKKELWSKVLQGDNMAEIRLPLGKGIAGVVGASGEIVNIPDCYADPRFNPDFDKRTGYRTNSMLCMPMRNKDGTIIGVFQLLNKKDGVFTKDDEEFIDALSAHASVAIENARLAAQMVQSERLSAVGRMASTIIHDIKNPMSTIRVYAQVMKRKSGNEEAAKLADEMIKQVDRFVNMTQEILDFTRGVSSMNIAEVEFGDLMNSVLDFIQQDLDKNNVKLIRESTFTGKLQLDQDKLIRVFYNIASNARDAMPNGGTLTVRTSQDGAAVRIEFIDSGMGMPEEVKKRIFEPFMTHGKKHGTGLGMAIVKKVIDDHKGRIEIDSEQGKGTTIRMFLPI
jgi:K+-sensing histidine kinase KdpD